MLCYTHFMKKKGMFIAKRIFRGLKRFAGYILLAFVFLGIFIVGVSIGSSRSEEKDNSQLLTIVQSDNRKLLDLITGYEEITTLYYNQAQNLSIIINVISRM